MVIFKKLKYQESFMRPNYLLFLFAFKKNSEHPIIGTIV